MAYFLETILEGKVREVARLRRTGLPEPPAAGRPVRDFAAALKGGDGVALIGEIKFASPSTGPIHVQKDPLPVAEAYAAAGAAAVSVLTDKRFFQGDIAYLPRIRAAVDLPILRKDFIIDPLQVEETALFGADALLLIARILSSARLKELLGCAELFGLTAVVEVGDREDAEKVLECGARVIGINNRDLRTFKVDLGRTLAIKPLLPADRIVVAASGIQGPEDVRRMAAAGVDAVLVGTALMRAADPFSMAASLVAAGCQGRGAAW